MKNWPSLLCSKAFRRFFPEFAKSLLSLFYFISFSFITQTLWRAHTDSFEPFFVFFYLQIDLWIWMWRDVFTNVMFIFTSERKHFSRCFWKREEINKSIFDSSHPFFHFSSMWRHFSAVIDFGWEKGKSKQFCFSINSCTTFLRWSFHAYPFAFHWYQISSPFRWHIFAFSLSFCLCMDIESSSRQTSSWKGEETTMVKSKLSHELHYSFNHLNRPNTQCFKAMRLITHHNQSNFMYLCKIPDSQFLLLRL